jgi:acetyltransferase-like isoleucine patch superfamily enzyme
LRLFLKKIYINFLKKFSINSFVDYDLYIRNPRNILFGKNLSINYGCSFFSSCQYYKNGGIIVMDNITFSPAVKIYSIAQNYKSPYFENIEEKVKINSNDKRCAG